MNNILHHRSSHVTMYLGVLMAVVLMGCGLEERPNYTHEVEIAPDRWLTLRERRGRSWFICEWNGKRVFWPGKKSKYGGDDLLRHTLREYEGNLYLIVLNREDLFNPRYVYLMLDNTGQKFVEIERSEFPKSIATENIVGAISRFYRVDTEKIDAWEKLRKFDIEDPYFTYCTTADIWMDLETGLSIVQRRQTLSYEERKRIIHDYAKKYKPVPLRNLVKEK